jgi:hypothetical protein
VRASAWQQSAVASGPWLFMQSKMTQQNENAVEAVEQM